jgi:EEF1A N-terminal glycine/lysine methyltransferase
VPQGCLWGSSPEKLTRHLDQPSSGFDLLILADLLFNHSEHSKLISSVQQTLKKSSEPRALVFFTPYRPWLLEKDLAFFDLARDAGFTVEKLFEHIMERAMFENDRGVSCCLIYLLFPL